MMVGPKRGPRKWYSDFPITATSFMESLGFQLGIDLEPSILSTAQIDTTMSPLAPCHQCSRYSCWIERQKSKSSWRATLPRDHSNRITRMTFRSFWMGIIKLSQISAVHTSWGKMYFESWTSWQLIVNAALARPVAKLPSYACGYIRVYSC